MLYGGVSMMRLKLNIYEILEIMREDQRQFDRAIAGLRNERSSARKGDQGN